MNIDRRIPDVRPDTPETQVTVKRCGHIIEIRYLRSSPVAVIEKVSAELYVDKRTGEVKEFCHSENRAESKASVAQSLRKLRDLINANLTEPEKALWVTLTYRENMRDANGFMKIFVASGNAFATIWTSTDTRPPSTSPPPNRKRVARGTCMACSCFPTRLRLFQMPT